MKYTESEINNLRGLELRAAVATEIFGFTVSPCEFRENGEFVKSEPVYSHDDIKICTFPPTIEALPAWESDHNAMMQVAEKMREWGFYHFQIDFLPDGGLGLRAYHPRFIAHVKAESLPVAVCRAALLYVAAQGDE